MQRDTLTAALAAALLSTTFSTTQPTRADLEQPEEFDPNDAVESIEFTIQVGEGGETLAEPVALDLGLGFPFWLHPIGKDRVQGLPVGATPQEGPDQAELAPGQSATFVFRREGDPGADTLQRTPQLLDGVRVSDVARLGIISQGTTNWELAGYRLSVNEKTFAARDDVDQRARDGIERAEIEWIEAREAIESRREEQDDLVALEQAGLATDEDLARLETLREETQPREKDAAWREGVSLGIYPWFVEPDLRVPGREQSGEIATAKVILTTSPHTNSETYNHVYFRTGGRKFFLYPPNNHFTHEANPQAFELNLGSGPLAAGDVRGFALGLVAHDRPYAPTPDRWHPERLVVELGGRPVYDSDSEPIDRRSMEVVRLIPPAHIDDEGRARRNEPNPLECFVWHAGRAQGLDLDSGGVAEVPGGVAEIDPEPINPLPPFPEAPPAPGGGEGFPADGGIDGATTPETELPPEWEEGTEIPGQDAECWPGEYPVEPDPSGGFPSDGGTGEDPEWPAGDGDDPEWEEEAWYPDPEGGCMPGGWWDWWFGGCPGGVVGGPGGVGGGPWGPDDGVPDGVLDEIPPDGPPAEGEGTTAWDLLVARLLELVEALLEALGRRDDDPEPLGEPPQIDNVQLVRDASDPQLFQVLWAVSGDESRISHFEVSLWHVRPDTEELLVADVTPIEQATVAAEIHVSEWMTPTAVADSAAYIQPMVVAVLDDESGTMEWPIEVGAALPWLPPDATVQNQPRPNRFEMSAVDSESSAWGVSEPILDQEPAGERGGVWSSLVLPTHRDLSLGSTDPTSNVAVRGASGGNAEVTLHYTVEQTLEPGRLYELIGHVGFLEASDSGESALVEARCTLYRAGQSASGAEEDREEFITEIEVSRAGPVQLLSLVIDPSVFAEGSDPPRITIKIPRGNNDPAAPVAVYGLRLATLD